MNKKDRKSNHDIFKISKSNEAIVSLNLNKLCSEIYKSKRSAIKDSNCFSSIKQDRSLVEAPRWFSNKTLVDNWFENRFLEEEETRAQLENLLEKRSSIDYANYNIKIDTCNSSYLNVAIKPLNQNKYMSISTLFGNLELDLRASISDLTVFKICILKNDSNCVRYNEDFRIMSPNGLHFLTSISDFTSKERNTGAPKVFFKRINLESISNEEFNWKIEPHPKDSLIELEHTPVKFNMPVYIKHAVTDLYLTLLNAEWHRPKIVCHRLQTNAVSIWSLESI